MELKIPFVQALMEEDKTVLCGGCSLQMPGDAGGSAIINFWHFVLIFQVPAERISCHFIEKLKVYLTT